MTQNLHALTEGCALFRTVHTWWSMERSNDLHRPFLDQLRTIQETVRDWEKEKDKIVAQMKSILNLQDQLDAIARFPSEAKLVNCDGIGLIKFSFVVAGAS